MCSFLVLPKQWHPTPVLLPGKSHGWKSLVGCSPWGRKESDTTERLHFNFSLSCIGEGNGNALQCSCLEHPRDGGAWWAAVYGVAQSQTQLKWLSSSSKQYTHVHTSTHTLKHTMLKRWHTAILERSSLVILFVCRSIIIYNIEQRQEDVACERKLEQKTLSK